MTASRTTISRGNEDDDKKLILGAVKGLKQEIEK
jgi:hypothetical protein